MVHLQDSGFEVDKIDMSNEQLAQRKADLGVPPQLSSCHTAEIDGYIIEGHVPAEVINKLLAEGADLAGLAVPGMPPGSPGMDGQLLAPLEILAFDDAGEIWLYTTWQ